MQQYAINNKNNTKNANDAIIIPNTRIYLYPTYVCFQVKRDFDETLEKIYLILYDWFYSGRS